MKKHLFFSFVAIIAMTYSQGLFAQNKESKKVDPNVFNEQLARQQAIDKGMRASEIPGYVRYLKYDFYSKRDLAKQTHKHTPYEVVGQPATQETVIYLEPNKPMSLGCPNMGFEQYNFNNWTGGIGTVATGPVGGNPVYTSTGASIVNTAGNNTPSTNFTNYHTIMSLPPVDPNFATINGYDPNACKAVGTQTISQIPFVSPFSFDPVSVRMSSEAAGNAACRLKYITTSSSTNQRLSFSYAVVLQNPSGHAVEESPYFKVEVRNEGTGAILPGCTSYTFNPKSTIPSDSLFQSVVGSAFDPTFYRKWQYYSVDLSTLPSGTNVSINFEVGGCTLGGHWGYAYVDAECGGIGTPYANMCSGSNFATLVAPTGFTTYQWYDPSNVLIPGATNDTLILGPPSNPTPVPGTVYSVNMVSPGGCVITQTVSIGFTTVNIINLNSNSSCAGGNSGSASVLANGSNGIYTYTWTATSGPNIGSVVSNSQTATGLAPGNYSVVVASTTCGQASANLSVGVSPPFFFSQTKSFCGNATTIPQTGGNNYIWYQNNVILPAPIGNNDTLYINNALAGDVYTVVYNNAQGCRDSIRYTLDLVAGGSSYFSNTANVCPNATNGATILNLNTPFSAPYSYIVTGPTVGTTVVNTSTTATTVSLSALSPGTYTAVINDGVCIYNNTVTIGVIQTNFTITPTNTVLCFPQEATLNLDFGDIAPTNCGLSTSGSCSSPNIIQVGNGVVQNTNTGLPCVFGNFYKNMRHQLLFTSAELLSAGIVPGKLSSIAFDVVSTLPNQVPTSNNSSIFSSNPFNFTIKIKCTNANVLTTSFDNSGLVQVYSGSYHPVTGWNTFNFNQAYEWPSGTNIIVDICYDLQTYYTSNPIMNSTNVGVNRCSYFESDGTVACGTTNIATTDVNRPNVRFGNCGASNPASYTVAVSANGTVAHNYANDSIKVVPSSPTPPAGGLIVYSISVTNPVGGCVETKTVAVLYPPLTTTITTAITNTVLCEGDNTTLSAVGAFNYNWSYFQSGGLTPISTASVVNVTPPVVGINTYVVTGYAPCPSSVPDTKTITVNVIPKANLIVTPLPDVTKCLNKSFVLNTGVGSTTPSNQGTPYSYSWTTLPSNAAAPGLNTNSSYTVSSNATTSLVVTVNGVCANPTSDTVVVKNYADDLGIAISNSIITCPNRTLTLNSTVTGGHAAYNYTWTVNNSPVANTANLNYTSPSSGGTYTVGVTVIDSCAYQKSDIDFVVVLPNTLNISIIDSIALCGNTPFTLSSISSGGYPSYTYQWLILPDNNSISNTSVLSYTTPQTEGQYTVKVTKTDSCGYQQSDFQVITVLPPCQVVIPNIITPNGDGANDYFKIKNIEYHPNTNVVIFDRWGRKVYENTNYNNEWKGEGLSDGTFFYIIDVPDDKKYNGFVTVFGK